MHEHNITNAVVHQILHECEDSGIRHPKKILLGLGLLTGYKADSVLFYFEQIRDEYDILRNAKLEIEEIQGKIFCNECKKESIVEPSPIQLCPKCDNVDVKVLEGNQISIKGII